MFYALIANSASVTRDADGAFIPNDPHSRLRDGKSLEEAMPS
jgi:hypothetical protein